MSELSKAKYAASGFIVGALFFGSIGYAASTSQSIQVSLQKVLFRINGVDKTTADGTYNNNGTKVPASFMYKGTNYLPMRMVAEMLGKEVNWDGKNSTVLVGSEKGEGVYLSDINPTTSNGNVSLNGSKMAVYGQAYQKGMAIEDGSNALLTYDLNGKYIELTALIGVDDWDNMYNDKVDKFEVSGDGKVLFSTSVIKGAKPQELKIDLSGVMELKIVVENKSYTKTYLDILNPFCRLK